jgi:NADH-quinone oxidoreductase subunit N
VITVLAQLPFTGPTVDWFQLTPFFILIGGGLVLMLAAALFPGVWPRGSYAGFTFLLGTATLVVSFVQWHSVAHGHPKNLFDGALSVDGLSIFISIVISIAVILTALFLDDYLRREDIEGPEIYALMLMSAAGGIVMAWSSDLIVIFLGLETLSLALYVLAASHLRRIRSQEAGVKYFILGGFSSAFFLYGIALVYGATGSTNLDQIFTFLANTTLLDDGLLLAGFALLLVGFAFKVSAAPFHMWTPDVYEGSPTPVTGFMAAASKAAAFAALIRVFVVAFTNYKVDWRPMVFALALISLAVGSVLAIVQTNVKRMLAYSSIAHAGYILVGIEAVSARGTASALFYILAYSVMILGSFGVVMLVGRKGDASHSLDAYRGLSHTRPVLAFTFTVLLLAQAGVPFTAGFVAKFDVILAAVDAKSYTLGVLAMLAAVVAAFMYLRIVVSMYMSDPAATDAEPVRVPYAAGLGLTLALAFTVIVGFVPGAVLDFARDAVPVFASR